MSFSVKAISDKDEISKLRAEWNDFVVKHSENPHLLHEFASMFTNMKYSHTWEPLFFVGYKNNKIIGIAPFMIRKIFGIHIVRSALTLSPSYIVADDFSVQFTETLLDLLFKILKCAAVNLVLSTNTSELLILEQRCRAKKIHFSAAPYIGSHVLPVEGSWENYEKLRGGRTFRRRFKKMENKLTNAGSFKFTEADCEEESDVPNKILDIDRASWKQDWRDRKGMTMDMDLWIAWKAASEASRNVLGFKGKAWILEFNNQPIAFALVYQNNHRATIAKTSYDSHFRNFYPGMFTIHNVVRDLFNSKYVKNIDFMTDLPFHEAWTSDCEKRKEITLGKGFFMTIILSMYMNQQIRNIMRAVLKSK